MSLLSSIKSYIRCHIPIVVAVLFALGCSDHGGQSPNPQQQTGVYPGVVEIGHLVALDMAPLFLAVERGYFEEEDLQVKTRFFANPGDNNAALASGDLQLTINPFTLPYLGIAAGGDFKFVSSAGGVGVIEIVAQRELGISSFDELVAKARADKQKIRIGSLKGDTLDVVVFRALEERGADYSEFEMVWFNDLLAMVQAFKSKDIDVLSHIKPYTTDLIVGYDAVSLGTNTTVWGLGTPNCVTMVTSEFAEKYPVTVQRYLTAIRRAYQSILDDPDQAAKDLQNGKYYRVGEQVLAAAIKTLPDEVILRPNMAGVDTAIQDLVEQGYMDAVDSDVYDSSFLDAIGQAK